MLLFCNEEVISMAVFVAILNPVLSHEISRKISVYFET